MTQNHQLMVERLSELERMVVQLTGRIWELQRELRQSTMFPERRQSGSCLRTLFGGGRSAAVSRPPIRENRRIERHEHCLF